MRLIQKIYHTIDFVNEWLGRIVAFASLGILAVIICEVMLRRLFNQPQIWTMDAICMLSGCYVILICAYGLLKRVYVSVDVLFAHFSDLAQHVVHLCTYLVFLLPFTLYMLEPSWEFFLKAYTGGERAYSVWMPHVWPVKLCFFAGIVLLFIQGISEILKQTEWILAYIMEKHQTGSTGDRAVRPRKEGK